MRPLIGITCYVEPARWGVWEVAAALLPQAYVEAVAAAGGLPVLVPPHGAVDPEGLLDRLDGVVLAGGADIDPSTYEQTMHPATAGVRADRDAAELPLAKVAMARNLPVLGICRGAQILNIARGGTLMQHLPDVVGHQNHRPETGVYGVHKVRTAPGSRIAGAMGVSAIVRSYHHQGIGIVGEGFVPTAWADDDTVEGLEDPSLSFAVGALWHPEASADHRLFAALVTAATAG